MAKIALGSFDDRGKDKLKEDSLKYDIFVAEARRFLNYIEDKNPDYFERLWTGQASFPQFVYDKAYGKGKRK